MKRQHRREGRTEPLSEEEERKLREEFDKETNWVKKIDDRVDLAELHECMQMITNFYTE